MNIPTAQEKTISTKGIEKKELLVGKAEERELRPNFQCALCFLKDIHITSGRVALLQ